MLVLIILLFSLLFFFTILMMIISIIIIFVKRLGQVFFSPRGFERASRKGRCCPLEGL